MFKIENLSFSYKKDQHLIDDISIMTDKRIIGVIGKNGCGKSTLLKLISKELVPDSGNIFVEGRIYRAIHDLSFYNKFTIDELLNLLGKLDSFNMSNKDNYIEGLHLTKFLHQPLVELSQGTYKKVGILFAFLSGANVILFDEPFESLDGVSANFVVNEIMSSPKMVVIVDHNIELITNVCDFVINMDN